MKKILVVALLGAFISAASLAGSYQAQVEGKLALISRDQSDDGFLFSANGDFYFSAVDTTHKPYAEAAFLNRASGVSTWLWNNGADDSSGLGVGAQVYIPDTMVYVGVNYSRADVGLGGDGSYSLTAGVTPIEGLLVTSTINDDGYDLNLDAKYVTALAKHTINFTGGFDDGGESSTLYLGADYYFSSATSAGLELTDLGSDSNYIIRAKHFYNAETFVGAYYEDSGDEQSIGANMGMRF